MIPAKFDSHGDSIPWECFEPTTSNGAAILLAYGSDGMSKDWAKMIRNHAQALASEGFLAIIPDYFEKPPRVSSGDSSVVFGQIPTRYADWQIALEDAASEATKIPGYKITRIGYLGYSLGGFLVLRARQHCQVLVEFFAFYKFPTRLFKPVITGLGSGKNPSLKAQIHHGGADDLVPYKEHVPFIEADLKAEGAAVTTMPPYPNAGHGFAGSDPDNQKALADATDATNKFFKANL